MITPAASSIQISLGEVAATLVLVALAIAVSFWRRADLEADIGIAVVRSAIQLTAMKPTIRRMGPTADRPSIDIMASGKPRRKNTNSRATKARIAPARCA